MNRCKCGSYAINIEGSNGENCDVCHYKYDALRYKKLTAYFLSSRTDKDDELVACNTQRDLDDVVDGL